MKSTPKDDKLKKFADENPCVCFNLRKASRVITQIYDDLFRELGLRSSQMTILNTVSFLGPITVSQLSTALATDRTTITRNLRPLKRDGYIQIQHGKDRREREVIVTKAGEEKSKKAMFVWEKFQKKIYDQVGKDEIDHVCSQLTQMLKSIEKV